MRIHHTVEGPPDAPVLVLSNSLGTSLELWSENVAALARSFRVVRYDQRGHGNSEVPSEPFGVDELGGDVLRLLDDLGVERVSFCGVSMGGATGMWLAVNAPERIDRLVVACTAAKFGETDKWFARARIVREDGLGAIVDSILRRWFTPGFRPDLVARFRADFLATPAEGYAACCEALSGWDYRERLGEIATPTLVLAGAHDTRVAQRAWNTSPPRPSRAPSSPSGSLARGSSSCPTRHTWRTCSSPRHSRRRCWPTSR